jgi:PleD family two-component response regulator
MLLDANLENGSAVGILKEAINVIVAAKRETDLVGWYRKGAILGIIFTEVTLEGGTPITERLRTKIETAFIAHMGKDRASKIAISMHTEG